MSNIENPQVSAENMADVQSVTKEAEMNPDAVTEAKIYTGKISYFVRASNRHYVIENPIVVEIGKWTAIENEKTKADYLDTYHAAKLLGLNKNMYWLCTGEDNERKTLISPGYDEDGNLLSFTMEQAEQIISSINAVLKIAQEEQAKISVV